MWPFKLGNGLVIYQDDGVMKVGTDGLLLAAWTNVKQDDLTVLDVGTGTGLIGCVICAENPASNVFAVDASARAIELCRINSRTNALDSRFSVLQVRFQDYAILPGVKKSVDLIVSNPPFFSENIKSPLSHRQESRHLDALPLEELVDGCHKLLKPRGRLSVILPIAAGERLEQFGKEKGWHTLRRTTVIPKVGRPGHRLLIEMIKSDQDLKGTVKEVICVRDHDDSYHEEYVQLVGRLHDRELK